MRTARFFRPLILGMWLVPTAAFPQADKHSFRDPVFPVRFEVPEGWEWSAQHTYPGIRASAWDAHGQGRMTLAVERIDKDTTAQRASAKSRVALEKVGFQVGRVAAEDGDAYILEATSPDKKSQLRQAYQVQGGALYILTLAAPKHAMRAYLRSFDDSLHSLIIEPRPREPDPPYGSTCVPSSQPTTAPKDEEEDTEAQQ